MLHKLASYQLVLMFANPTTPLLAQVTRLWGRPAADPYVTVKTIEDRPRTFTRAESALQPVTIGMLARPPADLADAIGACSPAQAIVMAAGIDSAADMLTAGHGRGAMPAWPAAAALQAIDAAEQARPLPFDQLYAGTGLVDD